MSRAIRCTLWTLGICLSLLLAGCGQSGPPAAPPMSGADLFQENCAACHGAEGRGPALETIRSLQPADLRTALRNHPTAGQIPQRLPASQLSELIDFLEQ